jgi:transcriptional regulator GlxA family with amidase domain
LGSFGFLARTSATDTTWEKVEDFKVAYPDVQLGDEMFLEEEENVVDSFIGKVYQRWPKKKVS